MDIIAYLDFGDNKTATYNKTYSVVGCRTHLMRGYGVYRPESTPGFDYLEVTLVAPGKEDLMLYEWYLKNTMYNGRLRFDLLDVRADSDEKAQRIYQFDSAQCFALGEHYDLRNRSQRLLTLKLTAKCFIVNDVKFGEDPDFLI